jgi:hypothetical protein
MNRPTYKSLLALAAAAALAASFPAHAWRAAGGYGRGVAVGPRGGVAAWNHGAGVARGPYGGAAAWNRGGYYGGRVYRPPVPVYRGGYYNYGYSGGEVAAAAVAGVAVGAMVGAAAASPAPSSTTVVVQQPSYSAALPVGSQVTVLPGNCASATVRGAQYYQCGPSWYKPYFGDASVYYQVVVAPY